VLEETGIEVEIVGLIDVVDSLTPYPGSPDRPEPKSLSHHYTLIDFIAKPVGGMLQAGDDASDARWVPIEKLDDYHLWEETIRIIHKAVRFLT
jgi:ADP-ribose pyrophosphatase YjhB (NUDIX family)